MNPKTTPVLSPKVPEEGKIDGSGTGGVAFVGRGAVDVFRAMTLASSLRLWARTGLLPTRGVGITKMLQMVREYTGHAYTRKQAERAADAVEAWAHDAGSSMAKGE